jgi:RNA 2',3'-cyclic 3'-phosphodiesterase
VTPIKDVLATVKGEPFEMTLAGVGRFPEGTRKPPRVLWVGVRTPFGLQAPPALLRLYKAAEGALKGVGFAPEDRGFSAHITLARLDIRGRNTPPEFERFLERHANFRSEIIHVESFVLYNSTLTPQGSIYQREAEYKVMSNE